MQRELSFVSRSPTRCRLCPAMIDNYRFILMIYLTCVSRLSGVCFPSVDAPFGASGFWSGLTRLSDAAICPASDAAVDECCEPVWEFADRNHITQACCKALWKALVLPAPSHRLLCHTLLRSLVPWHPHEPQQFKLQRLEPCNPVLWRAPPRRSAPSCWRAPR